MWLMAGLLLASASAGTADAATERLAMPYRCTKTGDRITVIPSAIRGLEVVGPRSSVAIELCETDRWRERGGACLPVEVHRFDVLCGDRRVAWADVAGAIARQSKLKISIALSPEAGGDAKKVVQRGVTCQVEIETRVRDRVTVRGGGSGYFLACREIGHDGPATRIALPEGYAPVGESGWIEPVVALAPDTLPARASGLPGLGEITSSALPDITPAGSGDSLKGRRVVPDVWLDTSEDEPGDMVHQAVEIPADPGEASAAQPELVDIMAALVGKTEIGERGVGFPTMLVSMMLLSAALAAVAFRRRRDRAQRSDTALGRRLIGASLRAKVAAATQRHGYEWTSPRSTGFAGSHGRLTPETANAVNSIGNSIEATRVRLGELTQAGPLIDVLCGELDALEGRLDALASGAAEGEETAQRIGPGLRNLVRELERIRRIVDSAALSIGQGGIAGAGAVRIPATRAEAFALLGINPDASDGTLKKVADGLRMSWHPDHARDDEDRMARETRIKAINAAVDLINGRRPAA